MQARPDGWAGCLRDGNELQLSRRYDRSYPVPRPSLTSVPERGALRFECQTFSRLR